MVSTNSILAHLHVARQHLGAARSAVTAALELIDEVREQMLALGVHSVAARFDPVRDLVERLTQRIDAGISACDTAIAMAHGARGDQAWPDRRGTTPTAAGRADPGDRGHRPVANPVGDGAAATGPPAAPAAPAETPMTGGAHCPRMPGFLESLPVRTRPSDPTHGVLTTSDGNRISDVSSGWSGPGHGGPRLRCPWRNMMSAVDHAEGHAAAVMRTRAIREATLYLNNPPCPDIPWGCDRVLPDILERGSRLTVYGPDGFVKTYEGTGKGIE